MDALLDTGAQVSLVDKQWKDKYLPDLDIHPLSELMELMEDKKMSEGHVVNGELIPFDGWVVISVNLPGNEYPHLSISVPFLVSSLPLEMPLIGFNVVDVVIQGKPERLAQTLAQQIGGAMSISSNTAMNIVHFVQTKKPGAS